MPPSEDQRGTGAVASPPDARDYRAGAFIAGADSLPVNASIREHFDVLDQGMTNACVGFTVAALYEEVIARRGYVLPFRVSPMALYYAGRIFDGSVGMDNGLSPRSALKAAQRLGIPAEHHWPFDRTRINDMPPFTARLNGGFFQLELYATVVSLEEVKRSIAEGYPLALSIHVTAAFNSPDGQGNVTPRPPGERPYSQHEILGVEYDDTRPMPGASGPGGVRIRNSYGTNWGQGGYAWISYDDFLSGTVYEIWAGR